MAAQSDAAASSSLKLVHFCFNLHFFPRFINELRATYDRNTLNNSGKESVRTGLSAVDLEAIPGNSILTSQTDQWSQTSLGREITKVGLKAVPSPSLLLANVHLQENTIRNKT